jgi:hypothetical protein
MNIRGREGNSIEAIKEAADAVTETIKNVREEAQESDPKVECPSKLVSIRNNRNWNRN